MEDECIKGRDLWGQKLLETCHLLLATSEPGEVFLEDK